MQLRGEWCWARGFVRWFPSDICYHLVGRQRIFSSQQQADLPNLFVSLPSFGWGAVLFGVQEEHIGQKLQGSLQPCELRFSSQGLSRCPMWNWPWCATSLSSAALEASQCPIVCQTIHRWPCSAVFKSSEDLGWAESDPGWKAEVEAAAFGFRGRRLKGVCLSVGVIVCFIFSQSLNQCLAVHINWQEIKDKFPKWKQFCLQQGSRKPGKTDKPDALVCRSRFWHRKW